MAKLWYIIHTYSGFERKVAESLKSRVKAFGVEEEIQRYHRADRRGRRGARRQAGHSPKMFYPGYVLVEMEPRKGRPATAWHVVKNTPRVTGFVGSGQNPTPLSEEEVQQIVYQVSRPPRSRSRS